MCLEWPAAGDIHPSHPPHTASQWLQLGTKDLSPHPPILTTSSPHSSPVSAARAVRCSACLRRLSVSRLSISLTPSLPPPLCILWAPHHGACSQSAACGRRAPRLITTSTAAALRQRVALRQTVGRISRARCVSDSLWLLLRFGESFRRSLTSVSFLTCTRLSLLHLLSYKRQPHVARDTNTRSSAPRTASGCRSDSRGSYSAEGITGLRVLQC